MTEHELIDATRRGDREAFGLLVQRYQRMVEAAAFCATGRHDLVDDIAQDTFITAWCTIERLRDTDSLRPWLYGIARNLGHKARRKHGRLCPLDSALASSPLDVERPSPLDALVERERDHEIAAAVGRLPARYREPLVLFYYEHCTVKEVAATLAVHEDAAMQRLSRGRRKLGEALATRVETVLESKPSRAALAAGLVLLLPTRTAAAAPHVAWLAAHGRFIGAVVGTAAAMTVLALAIGRSNALAAHAAARTPAPQSAQKIATPRPLPTPWTSLKPSVADPDHLYRILGVASLDPVETCAAGARQLVMAALGADAIVERDGNKYFEPSDELMEIRAEAGARTGVTCGGDSWPELYVICEGTLADIHDGTINCYPYDIFAASDVAPSREPPGRDNDVVIIDPQRFAYRR
jgi:RNA polymerase sigma factor (sigma-70 family)